ncbi:MAG: AMP-binding protein [Actinomycetaceae bacterium]|nr:AMP-binding protein [Actinomycetaceae bacterium]
MNYLVTPANWRNLTDLICQRPDGVLVPSANVATTREELRSRAQPLPGTDVVLKTSGSTSGNGHLVGLSWQALDASGRSTAQVLGEGDWLLALPCHHIAGFQVLARAALAGRTPYVLDLEGGFSPQRFAQLARKMPAGSFVSLVPTQLQRLLAAGEAAVLSDFAAVLVGGAPTSSALLQTAKDAGIKVVTTYGMTETCGGLFYNQLPLPGAQVRIVPEDARASLTLPGAGADFPTVSPATGRIELAGPMIAQGYLDAPTSSSFFYEGDTRWHRTNDIGTMEGGKLVVRGRADDTIISGGLKISATEITAALRAHPNVQDALSVGIPDPEWGEVVGALVIAKNCHPAHLRDFVADRLGHSCAPRIIAFVQSLPYLAPGKVDRRTGRAVLERARHDGTAWTK